MRQVLTLLICAMVVFTVCYGIYSYLTRTGLLGGVCSSWRRHSTSPKPTYSFIVAFGVPKVPPLDFDSESMAHRLTVLARCLDFIMGANNASAELVIVQWAPTVNNTLTRLINWEKLALRSLDMVRIIQVPQEHAHLAPPCVSSLHPYRLADPEGPVCLEFVAKNVGARRSLGQFLVLFNIDDILTPQLGSLFRDPHFWGTNVYWRATRNNLPDKLPPHLQGGELYDRALEMLGWGPDGDLQNSMRGPLFAESHWQISELSDESAGDFLLIGSKDFFRIGGYPEIGLEYHIDNLFLTMASTSGILHGALLSPYSIMHQSHTTRGGKARVSSIEEREIGAYLGLELDNIKPGTPLTYSNPKWGLAGLDIPEELIV